MIKELIERFKNRGSKEQSVSSKVWLVGHRDLLFSWMDTEEKHRKIWDVVKDVENERIIELGLSERFMKRANATDDNGIFLYLREHNKFRKLVTIPAYEIAHERVELPEIRFFPVTLLVGKSRLYVRAQDQSQALERALAVKDIIKEYLSVEVLPDEPVLPHKFF